MRTVVRLRVVRSLAAAVVLLTGSLRAFGQTTTATIEGTIRDRTGAVLPGVSIQVQGATLQRSVVSDNDGFYRAPALMPGRYTIVATLSGFQSPRLESIEV